MPVLVLLGDSRALSRFGPRRLFHAASPGRKLSLERKLVRRVVRVVVALGGAVVFNTGVLIPN